MIAILHNYKGGDCPESFCKIKTEMKRDKIKSQLSVPDHEAMRMFNGVSHAYHIARPEKSSGVNANDDDAMDVDDDETELEEELEMAMEQMRFGEEDLEEDDEPPDEFGPLHGHKSFCAKNIWKEGWEAIKEMNVKVVRENTRKRRARKRELAKYVVKKVSEMREQSANVDVGSEMETVDDAPWTTYVHGLRPNVYK